MKFFPTISRGLAQRSDQASDEPSMTEVTEFSIPTSELEAFAARLLELNAPNDSVVVPDHTEIAIAKKIISIQTDVSKILEIVSVPIRPALDVLLDLYISESKGRRVSVSDASIAANCPMTTGLRWVGALEDAKLVQRNSDANDQRRRFISLTPLGRALTLKCIQAYSNIAVPRSND
ncbi:hypothetical protein EH31_06605 [Erythrobacter longus]|uniref:HTH marR-type domain-containing protein n=1 Tax=Erythrobacter longus TaxID=1044 RepID=A0A074MM67_ERYLO|nr:hypothetical protein [Erythrobacter longus]KEO86732.1 hypothetical protein EH31_06605 [Erythrobacter longus]